MDSIAGITHNSEFMRSTGFEQAKNGGEAEMFARRMPVFVRRVIRRGDFYTSCSAESGLPKGEPKDRGAERIARPAAHKPQLSAVGCSSPFAGFPQAAQKFAPGERRGLSQATQLGPYNDSL